MTRFKRVGLLQLPYSKNDEEKDECSSEIIHEIALLAQTDYYHMVDRIIQMHYWHRVSQYG